MKDAMNNILTFFYTEKGPVSAYNNRFIFGITESDFYHAITLLEEEKLIEAVGIRHTVPGYNIYQITKLGIEFVESGGIK
jgi:DNA-binding PadR family transcriptional regulator